jgi:hypothetical protein
MWNRSHDLPRRPPLSSPPNNVSKCDAGHSFNRGGPTQRGLWEVCAGPNRSLLAWEVSSEWLNLMYLQLRLRLPAQMGAGGRGSPKSPCHHDAEDGQSSTGRASGSQQPRDLLGVPAVRPAGVRTPRAGLHQRGAGVGPNGTLTWGGSIAEVCATRSPRNFARKIDGRRHMAIGANVLKVTY